MAGAGPKNFRTVMERYVDPTFIQTQGVWRTFLSELTDAYEKDNEEQAKMIKLEKTSSPAGSSRTRSRRSLSKSGLPTPWRG